MGMKESAKAFGARFRLDSHHTIERFGVMVTAMAVSFVMIMGASVAFSIQKHRQQLGTKAVYTTTFTTSKTKVKGDVKGVYSNESHTRAMLLLKFDDVRSISAVAKEYQTFLTGADPEGKRQPLKSAPAGGIYIFGNTGYMGIYLVDAGGMPSQIMNVVIRAKAELVVPQNGGGSKKDVTGGDVSFEKYDQFRVFFNPGASGATKVKALEAEVPNVRDLYNEMVVKPQEEKVRTKLDDKLKVMQADLTNIEQKTKLLSQTSIGTTGVKVMAPGAMNPSQIPAQIAGDKVEGQEATSKDSSSLKLVSTKTLGGGYDFDWRSGSVGEGYLDDLLPDGMDYVTFLSKKGAEKSDQINVSDIKWTMTNGQLLSSVNAMEAAYKPVNDIVLDLSNAYSAYFQDKQEYQCDLLPELIELEVGLRDVEANNTINTDKNAVLVF